MKVELIDCTDDGINKIARLARSTRMNSLEEEPDEIAEFIRNEDGTSEIVWSEEYIEWQKKNEKFVRELIKVQHLGVLEHINFTFHISEISRVTTHQLVRHRLASYLQMSSRHAKPNKDGYIMPPSCKTPDDWEDEKCDSHEIFEWEMKHAYLAYEDLLAHHIPVEDARYVLPPAFFTHISMTCNARTLLHFLELRLAKGAQWEVKEMAIRIYDIVYNIYPILFDDLKDLRDSAVCDINYKE